MGSQIDHFLAQCLINSLLHVVLLYNILIKQGMITTKRLLRISTFTLLALSLFSCSKQAEISEEDAKEIDFRADAYNQFFDLSHGLKKLDLQSFESIVAVPQLGDNAFERKYQYEFPDGFIDSNGNSIAGTITVGNSGEMHENTGLELHEMSGGLSVNGVLLTGTLFTVIPDITEEGTHGSICWGKCKDEFGMLADYPGIDDALSFELPDGRSFDMSFDFFKNMADDVISFNGTSTIAFGSDQTNFQTTEDWVMNPGCTWFSKGSYIFNYKDMAVEIRFSNTCDKTYDIYVNNELHKSKVAFQSIWK